MQASDLMEIELVGGPGDGRRMMTPDSNTEIHSTFETDTAYEIHRYERIDDTELFGWMERVR